MLSYGEKLVINDKASAGFLLHIERLQRLPSGSGVILLSLDVNSLIWHQIEHQLSRSPVLFDVPGLLLLGWCAGARFFAIYELPEAFGVQEDFHLFAPDSIHSCCHLEAECGDCVAQRPWIGMEAK